MCLDWAKQLARCFLARKVGIAIIVGIDIIILIIGLAILGCGILVTVKNESLFTNELRTTLNKVSLYEGLSLGTLITVLIVICICVGAFIVFVAVVGLIGTCRKSRKFLIAYIIMILVVMGLQIAYLALWFIMREKVVKTLEDKMYEALAVYDGVSSTDESSNGWDTIFLKYECCGAADITSTKNDKHFNHTKYWRTKPKADKVPTSCCKGATKTNYKTYTNTACTKDLTDNWQQSCYDKLRDELVENYMLGSIVLVIVGFAVVELAALILACLMYTISGTENFRRAQTAARVVYTVKDGIAKIWK